MHDAIDIPAFDTDEWRELRNEKLRIWLQDGSAVEFVQIWATLCEFFDDLWDGDKEITAARIEEAVFLSLVDMADNAFFRANGHLIAPVALAGVNAWFDANRLEKSDDVNDRIFAYSLRDQYMDVLCLAIAITRGRETMRKISLEVREFFTAHETFEAYDAKLKALQA